MPRSFAGAYVVLAPETIFTWHLYPVTVITVSLALLPVATLLERWNGAVRWGLASVCVGLCALGTIGFAFRAKDDAWFGGRDRIYQDIAAYLVAKSAPTDLVDAEEVGTLAYYADLPMNDHARIVTRYPGDAFWKLEHGRPTALRWLILNKTQLDTADWERPFFAGRPMVVFTDPPWRLWVVDLTTPAR